MSHVLVINSGSSSLKYQLVDPVDGSWSAKGLVERIGLDAARLVQEVPGKETVEIVTPLKDHAEALALVLKELEQAGPGLDDLLAVGHRGVHGGAAYQTSVIFDDEVDAAIERLIPLAPLHNPPTLLGMRELKKLMPNVPHVVVFDTAFHTTMPPEAYTYAIPTEVAAANRVRRYGFHGTSYRYVTRKAAEFLGIGVEEANLIICHLGNGASMAAVRGGVGVDTTMGISPLAGLVMGTRSGDIDPSLIFHLVRVGGMTLDEVDHLLNKESGLKGLSGEPDMREVRALANAGDERARLALDVYGYRIRATIGAYLAVVPGVQAVVFTAGIGENDVDLRREVCEPLAHLGLHLDAEANAVRSRDPRAIDDGTGPIRVLVIPTDEEAEIAREAAEAVAALGVKA